jgi:hypothetical protein
VKRYDLFVDGCYTPLTAAQIETLFRAGMVRRRDFCKETTLNAWRTVGQIFPDLEHQSEGPVTSSGAVEEFEAGVVDRRGRRISTGILATCAILLVIAATSSLSLPLLAKLGRRPRHVPQPRPPEEILADLNATTRPLQNFSYGISSSSLSSPPRALDERESTERAEAAGEPAPPAEAASDTEAAPPTPADMEDLEKSIAWYDHQIENYRANGRDTRWFEEHRDALRQKRVQLADR